MEFVFSFKINNENSYLFEIKYLNLPKDTPRSEKLKIFLYENKELKKLKFKSMHELTRTFEDEIFLDMKNLTLKNNDNVYEISKCDDQENQFLLSLIYNQ